MGDALTPTPTPIVPFGFSANDWSFFMVFASAVVLLALCAILGLKLRHGGSDHAK